MSIIEWALRLGMGLFALLFVVCGAVAFSLHLPSQPA
jgi:hypothetical protein